MSRDTTVIAFRQPNHINDPMTELAREGARRMLAQVLVAEADAFVAMWKDLKLPDGRDRIVRHGHLRDPAALCVAGRLERACLAFVEVLDGYTLSDLVKPRAQLRALLSVAPTHVPAPAGMRLPKRAKARGQ